MKGSNIDEIPNFTPKPQILQLPFIDVYMPFIEQYKQKITVFKRIIHLIDILRCYKHKPFKFSNGTLNVMLRKIVFIQNKPQKFASLLRNIRLTKQKLLEEVHIS